MADDANNEGQSLFFHTFPKQMITLGGWEYINICLVEL